MKIAITGGGGVGLVVIDGRSVWEKFKTEKFEITYEGIGR